MYEVCASFLYTIMFRTCSHSLEGKAVEFCTCFSNRTSLDPYSEGLKQKQDVYGSDAL